jgi:hypothetical protein
MASARFYPEGGRAMGAPTEVVVKLDLDSWLARYGATVNEDGDREVIPMTLEDIVVDRTVRLLFEKAMKDDSYRGLRSRVQDVAREEIVSVVSPMITEALASPFRKVSSYGEATGPEITLREVIVEEVRAYLTKSPGYDRRTAVQTFIAEEVKSVVSKELKSTLDAAKAEVFGAVKANAASMIADAVRKAVLA